MNNYSDSHGYRSRGLSPGAVAGVVAAHVLLAGALISMTNVTFLPKPPDITWVTFHKAPPKPPEVAPVPPSQPKGPDTQDRTTTFDRPIVPATFDKFVLPPFEPIGGGIGGIDTNVSDKPVAEPVFVAARLDNRYADRLQPAYPPAMRRLQIEGSVTVRVMIDADGRVIDVWLVKADDPSFFEATRAQALKAWRFLPATRDGLAVSSEKTLTVRFKLTD